MRICFFLRQRFVFLGLFVFSDGRTHDFLGGAWAGSQPGKKKAPRARPEGFFPLWLPSRPLFFFGPFVFFWPDGRTLHGEGAFVFFLRLRFVFLGLFFFGRTDARFPGWGPDGKPTIKFTFPKGAGPSVRLVKIP